MDVSKIFVWCLAVFFISCEPQEENKLSFYHWKNDTTLSSMETRILQKLEVEDIYLRFFDIDVDENEEPYPVSVIRKMDEGYDNYAVVPVVFITNKTFKNSNNVLPLTIKVKELINQMYQHHFDTIPKKIQIDCDWTVSTKDNYFEFLEVLKLDYQLSVTIRLHQVKYQKRTGIPPVDEGSLMVYNLEDIKDTIDNSIFSLSIVKKYITPQSDYPLPLDLALPLYSWGIIKLPDDNIKILNNLTREAVNKLDTNYRQVNSITFEVIHPHFLQGYFLPRNTILKVEEVNFNEVLEANTYLKKCNNINWKNTLLYHLDDEVLGNYSAAQLLELIPK